MVSEAQTKKYIIYKRKIKNKRNILKKNIYKYIKKQYKYIFLKNENNIYYYLLLNFYSYNNFST